MHPAAEPESAAHAPYAASLRPIGVALVLLALLCGGALWAMDALFGALMDDLRAERPAAHALRTGPDLPPGPRLQATPASELAEHERASDELAASYAWIDRPAGVVRLPLERALELVLARGLPSFEAEGELEGQGTHAAEGER